MASSTSSHSEHALGLTVSGRPDFIRVESPMNFVLLAGLEFVWNVFAACFRTNSKALTDRVALLGLNLTAREPVMIGAATKGLFNHDQNRYVVTSREDF